MQTDLTCPQGVAAFGVTVDRNAILDLNGHTLSGGEATVRCMAGDCIIHGPGTISGAKFDGIDAWLDVKRIILEDATISDNGYYAIAVSNGRRTTVELTNVAIDRNNSMNEFLATRSAHDTARPRAYGAKKADQDRGS